MPKKPKITAEVGNRITCLLSCPDGLDPDLATLLKPVFAYRKSGYKWSRWYKQGTWDGYTNLLKGGKVSTGLFLEQLLKLQELCEVEIHDTRSTPAFRDWLPGEIEKFGERQFQRECVEAMVAASNTGGLVLNATGSGKTFIAAMFLARLKGSACFVVDELTLLEQAREELSKVTGEPVGIVGKGTMEPQRLTVATVQTLAKHKARKDFKRWFSTLDILLIDEFHVAMNRSNISVVATAKPKAVFGLTATLELAKTPVRLQATALAGPVVFSYDHATGVQEGVLAKGCLCQVTHKQDGWGGAYKAEYKAMVVKRKLRNNLIVDLARVGVERGHKVVVLVERLLHLRILTKRLQEIPHRVICGSVDVEGRQLAKQEMEAGHLNLIIANRVFGKGVNIKVVDMIIDGTATRSGNNARQRYGRGTRVLEGKRGLLYFDVADTKDKGKNRFAKATRSRRKAFMAAGVPVVVKEEKLGAVKLVEAMEKRL